MRGFWTLSGLFCLSIVACGSAPEEGAGALGRANNSVITPGSPEEAAVLALVNDPTVDQPLLDDDVGLDSRAATNIVAHRDGPDGTVGTSDDDGFDTIEELDAVSYVGESALDKLLAYAQAHGYMAGSEAPTEAELDYATLALANDHAVGQAALDDDVQLDSRAAKNIVEHRNGVDGLAGTADDRTFMSIADLDAISYVGDGALARMRDYAVAHGYLDAVPSADSSVIFSPQSYYQSHNVEVAARIDAAVSSIDIAMYSLSDEGIFDALEAAVLRGVSVRFIFDSASEDRKKTGTALASTKSARLEAMGVDVRWVNKTMHHKLAIIDGPRTMLAAAESGLIVTGSGNWSYGAATQYDENTLFLQGHSELALRLQREFNHLWDHSRDFVFDPSLSSPAAIAISESDIVDDPATDAHFTSDNFSVSGDTFSIVSGNDTVADAWVGAIESATDSIWIASGHLRSRPIAEALMAKAQANPSVDIRIYLDGQEYISEWYNQQQLDELDTCLTDAGTSLSKQRICLDKGFLYSYRIGQAGVAVRFKYYAFRWDYSYAPQMHNKLMIVDGDELWTGSYNLSDNAEHNTFDSTLVFKGLPHAPLIAAYEASFEMLWNTNRDGSYATLLDDVNNAPVIPLVFAPMALTWDEVAALKSAISSNCPAVYSDEYQDDPAGHQSCPR